MPQPSLSWFATCPDEIEHAKALGLTIVERPPAEGFYLAATGGCLRLCHARAAPGDAGFAIDFLAVDLSRRLRSGRKSPLARALGLHRHAPARVLDTTCGLGRDSATLAALGCEVVALERHPGLFALLEDARRRAEAAVPPPDWLARWPVLHHANAHGWLMKHPPGAFDVIYIDPMFDAPRRKARPQKALAWLGELIGTDHDAGTLLQAARGRAARRVVVKQHARGAALAPPDFEVRGKAVRFDIYLSPRT